MAKQGFGSVLVGLRIRNRGRGGRRGGASVFTVDFGGIFCSYAGYRWGKAGPDMSFGAELNIMAEA